MSSVPFRTPDCAGHNSAEDSSCLHTVPTEKPPPKTIKVITEPASSLPTMDDGATALTFNGHTSTDVMSNGADLDGLASDVHPSSPDGWNKTRSSKESTNVVSPPPGFMSELDKVKVERDIFRESVDELTAKYETVRSKAEADKTVAMAEPYP